MLKYTTELPDKTGYYWFNPGNSREPVVLYVSESFTRLGCFYANGGEYSFLIEPPSPQKCLLDFIPVEELDESLLEDVEQWCYIPEPIEAD